MGGSSWGGAKYGGLDITIRVIQGRDLVAKDRSRLSGRRTKSDPYVMVVYNRKVLGRTHAVQRTLSPRWWYDDDVVDPSLHGLRSKFTLKLGPAAAKRVARLGATDPARQVEFRVFDEDPGGPEEDDPMGVAYVPLPLPPPVPPPLLYEEQEKPKTVIEKGWVTVESGPKNAGYHCTDPSGEIEVMVSVTAIPSKSNAQSVRIVMAEPRRFSLFRQKRKSEDTNENGPDAISQKFSHDSSSTAISQKFSDDSSSTEPSLGEKELKRSIRGKNSLMVDLMCLMLVLLVILVAIAIGVAAASKASGGGGGETNGATATLESDVWGAGTTVEPDFSGNVLEIVCAEDIINNEMAYDACDDLCEKALCCFIPQSREKDSCSSNEQCTPYKKLCKHLPDLHVAVNSSDKVDKKQESEQHR